MERLEQISWVMTETDMRFLADLSEKVSRDNERMNKLENGEKFILRVEEIQAVVQQITMIIHQEVTDPIAVDRIADRLQQLKW